VVRDAVGVVRISKDPTRRKRAAGRTVVRGAVGVDQISKDLTMQKRAAGRARETEVAALNVGGQDLEVVEHFHHFVLRLQHLKC